MEICDRMSVMRDGKMIGTVERQHTDQRLLANMMVGREVLLRVGKGEAHPGATALKVEHLSLAHPTKPKKVLDDVSFDVRRGEILGVAGIEGNGQSELVECITGLLKPDSGSIWVASGGEFHDITAASARQRRALGVSHVPEDRNGRGLVLPYSAALNSVLGDHYREPYRSEE